jgi:hypothetical protein
MQLKEQVTKAVAALVAAGRDDYNALLRTIKTLHMLETKCSIDGHPELNVLLRLDADRLGQILQIVAVRRDKEHATPSQLWRREYMRNYMRQKRRSNPEKV